MNKPKNQLVFNRMEKLWR